MIEVADSVDYHAWLLDLEHADGAGTVQTARWTDSADPIAVVGEGVYAPDNPVIALGGFNQAGSRLQRREWFVALADPQRTWQARYASRWRRRRCRLLLWTMPGPVSAVLLESVRLAGPR